MDINRGCNYCANLISHDSAFKEFSCRKYQWLKIENAGACFVAEFRGRDIIIESCPGFERGEMIKADDDWVKQFE